MPNQGVGSRPGRVRPLCRCGQPKAVTKSGRRQDACATCLKAKVTAWCAANRERRLDISRRSGRKAYAANPQKAKAVARAYVEANREVVRAKAKAKYAAIKGAPVQSYIRGTGKYIHRPHVRAARAMWRTARRAAQSGAEVHKLTPAMWADRLLEFEGACAYCLRMDRPLARDHMQPLSRSGPHCIENVVPACKSCNSRKRNRGILAMIGA